MVRPSPRVRPSRRPGQRWHIAACCALLAALVVPMAPAAAETTPTVRLRATASKVTLHQMGGRLYLDLPALIAAQSGAFEIRVTRDGYDAPVTAAQVDATTGEVLRPIPDELLAGWEGLRGFFAVEVKDKAGNVVRSRRVNWCPNRWDGQRADDSGPTEMTYPFMCAGWFPFVKGMVWGLDAGWATTAMGGDFDWAPSVRRLPPGKYDVTLRIRPPHARFFEVPKAGRAVTLQATVVDADWNDHDDFHKAHAEPGALAELLGEGADLRPGEVHEPPQDPLEAGMTNDPALVPAQSVSTIDDPDPSTLPDLVALPAWGIFLRRTRAGKDMLAFTTTPWNAGPAPFVIEGFRREGEDLMDAYQYFFDADGKVVGRASVGTLNYHRKKGHNHWHFLHFARFDLLDSTKEHVVKSRKQGFCIVPTDPVDLTVERAAWRPSWEQGSVCGGEEAIWVREVLPAGWGDTYTQAVAGQAFDVTDLPNGTYYIKVTVNGLGKVHQARTDNDEALRRVRIGGTPGNRWVRVTPFQGLDV